MKNSINRLLVKFGTVDRRPGNSRRAHTDENVDTIESLLLSQEDKPQSHRTVREISHEAVLLYFYVLVAFSGFTFVASFRSVL